MSAAASEQAGGPRGLVLAATACAAVVLASQLAGKAARDAIFLEQFEVKSLPILLAVSSALAIATTFLIARRLSRGAPVRVVQLANATSAGLLVVEWMLLDVVPRPAAIVIYVHQTLLGPILVSGFWSVVSECFDPRTARRFVGTVGTGATVGAVLGAVIAERVAALAGAHALLPTVAALQLVAGWRLAVVGRGCLTPAAPEEPAVRDVAHNIARVSLLRRLALITVIVTVAAALLDFVFKAYATAAVTDSADLARLFATFHGIVGVLTALVQWMFGRWALQRWGLARTLATLPGAVIAFGTVALLLPGLGTFIALRGAENVVRNSLYREAYEVFYTPLLAQERRATKTVIDVGVERFGDVLGGVAVLGILAVAGAPVTVLLVGALVLSMCGVVLALQAQRGYVEALERSLVAHAIDLDLDKDAPRDRTTRTTLELVAQRAAGASGELPRAGTSGELARAAAAGELPRASRWPFRGKRDRKPPPRGALDPSLSRLKELVSGDPVRIRRALADGLLSPASVAHAIPLLARADVADAAERAITAVAGACIGQLVDAARDPQLPLPARAKLPAIISRAIAAAPGTGDEARARLELARSGLAGCLLDSELEIRARAADALAELRERHPDLAFDAALVFDGVRRELALPAALGDPTRVQHLATLLALALPAEPIRTAFHGLHTEDQALRGVALEYLENVLPGDIVERMWTMLAIEAPVPAVKRPLDEVIAELLHRRSPRDDAAPPRPDADLRETHVDLRRLATVPK